MADDIFATPELRTRPMSRVLRRKSQMQPQRLEVTAFPEPVDVTTFSVKDVTLHVRFIICVE